MTSLTKEAVAPLGVKPRDAERSKNFFALGLVVVDVHPPGRARRSSGSSSASRPSPQVRRRQHRPRSRPATPSARRPSCSTTPTRSSPATLPPGTYTNITGNTALAWGLVAAGQLSELPLFLGLVPDHAGVATSSTSCRSTRTSACAPCRPRTRSPASAPPSAPPTAATSASRPPAARAWRSRPRRWAWPSASSCRCSSSTSSAAARRPACPPRPSRPTCCMAMYGRHGESPLPIVAAHSPPPLLRGGHRGGPHRAEVPHAGDPAVRRLPGQRHRAVAAARRRRRCPTSSVTFATEPNHVDADGEPVFWPYLRDPETLARPWALPGTPGLMHRIGGLEKEDGSGNICYDPANHEHMVRPAGRRRSPASPTTSRRRGARRRRRRRAARRRVGLDLGRHRRRGGPGPRRRATRSPTPTSCTSTRSRRTSARCCGATRRCWCPR